MELKTDRRKRKMRVVGREKRRVQYSGYLDYMRKSEGQRNIRNSNERTKELGIEARD